MLTGYIPVHDLQHALGMASSDKHRCLYICDGGKTSRCIHRIGLADHAITKWSLDDEPAYVMVMRNENVLVTLADRLLQYTTDGQLVKKIFLDVTSIGAAWCSTELSAGQFVVGHGMRASCEGLRSEDEHQLCIIDESGSVIHSFGEEWGVSEELSDPHCLVTDSQDQVVVGDRVRCRLGLFGPTLSHLGEIQRLDDLYESFVCVLSAVHWDESTSRLYVGDLEGFVYVLGARHSSR